MNKQAALFRAAGFLCFFLLVSVPTTIPASAQVAARTNPLPACGMDSFVKEAKEHAEDIYGDESFSGPPPYEYFDKAHRINTGILDQRDQGLTTGHGSLMPDASGRDEFLGQEWSQSGTQGVSEKDGFYAGLPVLARGALPTNKEQFPGGFKLPSNAEIEEYFWKKKK